MRHSLRRNAYTLLEVILALAISVMVLSAVYAAIGYQLRMAQYGRDTTERSTLVRSLFNRLTVDIRTTVAVSEASVARRAAATAASGTGGGTSTTGAASTTGASSTTGAASTTGATSSTGTGTSSTSTASTAMGDSSSTATSDPITVPLGIMGSADNLRLYMSRVPSDAMGNAGDVRRIEYWLDERGLCRMEISPVTSDDALNADRPAGDDRVRVLVAEAKSVEFSYFDGTNWLSDWDSTAVGDDGVTPTGSPRAICIRVGLPDPARPDGELRVYRHVVLVMTANGTTQQLVGGGTQ